jgi:SAM-dependent methyltransferase
MGGVRPNARENGQISPSTTVWAARGDGSCPNCAFVLQEGGKTASIHGSSGVIWRIPVKMRSTDLEFSATRAKTAFSWRECLGNFQEYIQKYQDAMKQPPLILEAGGGSVTRVPTRNDAKITLVDISDIQLSANTHASEKILADLHEVHLPTRHFDIAICWDVLEHLRDPRKVVRKLLDCVKAGGIVVIGAPDQDSLPGMITKYTPHWFHVAVFRYVFRFAKAGKPGHPPFPTVMSKDMRPSALTSLAAANGATVVLLARYESSRREWLRAKSPFLSVAFGACLWLLNAISLRKRQFELSDFVLILRVEPTAAGDTSGPTNSTASQL